MQSGDLNDDHFCHGILIVDISLFDFELPESLIAQEPTSPRDHCRLMVLDRSKSTWSHHFFHELPSFVAPGDLIVRNNTRVIPARLIGKRNSTGGQWECLVLEFDQNRLWNVMTQTRGKPVPGEIITVGNNLQVKLLHKLENGRWIITPIDVPAELTSQQILEQHGHIPLPHYIRHGTDMPQDRQWYQTVFAQESGSVAAPTAGLHFTPELIQTLTHQGIDFADVTLHVGIGTFQPIRTTNILDHQLHAETAELPQQTVDKIIATKNAGKKVIAVGTTSTRTLEAGARSGQLQAYSAPTDLYITPGFKFQVADALITNFHLPKSSLMVLVSAFAGREFVMDAYQEAIRQSYKFYSYGDAMLIL